MIKILPLLLAVSLGLFACESLKPFQQKLIDRLNSPEVQIFLDRVQSFALSAAFKILLSLGDAGTEAKVVQVKAAIVKQFPGIPANVADTQARAAVAQASQALAKH